MIAGLAHDLRHGARSFLRNPGFTLVAVLTLAIGIGANAAIFSVVSALIFRPLPYDDADRLVWVWGNNSRLGVNQGYLSSADIYDFQQHSSSFEEIAAWTTLPINLVDETSSERLEGIPVQRVAIVNEAFVRQFFNGDTPVGRRVQVLFSKPMECEVVGVVGDVRHRGYDAEARPEMYVSYLQETVWPVMNLVVRTHGEPLTIAALVRHQIESVDPAQAIFNVRPLETMLRESIAERRFNLVLLLAFALVAVLTAAAGIYGIMTYFVSQRTSDIGIRMALGASRRDVLQLILGHGMTLTICGVGLGLLAALIVTRVLATLLFGVSAIDPLTFAGVLCS